VGRRIRKLIKELFRRKVVRVVIAYMSIVLATVLAVAQLTEDSLAGRPFITETVTIVGVLLIPLVAYLAWRYDIVPPHFVRDIKDIQEDNPGLNWARLRHEAGDAGYVLLAWTADDGTRIEKRFFQPVAIGRAVSNDIEFADERVSRYHAVLWAQDGVWHVRDMESANGTFVGHARITGSFALPQTCDLRFHVNGPCVTVHIAKAAATRVG
jgi:hypothetical protein